MNDPNVEVIRRNLYPAPTMEPHKNSNGMYQIIVPGEGSAGNQVFMAPTIEGLASKLAASVWHGTNKIRELMRILRDVDGTFEREREAAFYNHPDRIHEEF